MTELPLPFLPEQAPSSSTMRVLVTVRDIKRKATLGGIGNYYRALRPHFGDGVVYFTVGTRPIKRSWIDDIVRIPADYWRFWRILGKQEFDIVTLNPSLGRKGLPRDAVFLLLAKARRKRVAVFFRGWADGTEAAIDRRWSWLFHSIFRRADAMIVLSGRFKQALRRWGYRGPVFLETTTVDEQLLTIGNGAAADLQDPQKTCTVLYLARVRRDKGIFVALEAFHLAQTMVGSTTLLRLMVAGDGSDLDAARAYIRANRIEGVEFLGYLHGEEKATAFRSADIYLFPSMHGEGMPNSVLEAMAFGLPVVARPVGGVADFFVDGKMGFLTEGTEPQDFAELLIQLITNEEKRREIARYNAQYAQDRFFTSRVARRIEEIWKSMGAHD